MGLGGGVSPLPPQQVLGRLAATAQAGPAVSRQTPQLVWSSNVASAGTWMLPQLLWPEGGPALGGDRRGQPGTFSWSRDPQAPGRCVPCAAAETKAGLSSPEPAVQAGGPPVDRRPRPPTPWGLCTSWWGRFPGDPPSSSSVWDSTPAASPTHHNPHLEPGKAAPDPYPPFQPAPGTTRQQPSLPGSCPGFQGTEFHWDVCHLLQGSRHVQSTWGSKDRAPGQKGHLGGPHWAGEVDCLQPSLSRAAPPCQTRTPFPSPSESLEGLSLCTRPDCLQPTAPQPPQILLLHLQNGSQGLVPGQMLAGPIHTSEEVRGQDLGLPAQP